MMIQIDMDMPSSCYDCRMSDEDMICKAMPEDQQRYVAVGYVDYKNRIHEKCPLIEVKDNDSD